MSLFTNMKSSLSQLKSQYSAFSNLRAIRAFHARSKRYDPTIREPDWVLVLVITFSFIALGMLFVDEAAGYWKATLPKETYDLFQSVTRWGKSENYLVPSGLAVLVTALLPWQRLTMSAKAALCQLQMAGLFIFIAVAGAGLSNNILKILIGRGRPRYFEEFGPHYFNSPGFASSFQSFPSGHSTTVGAMAIALTLLFPRLKWLWIAAGMWIAFSRIVVGAHYPSDIVAGFVYGAVFAWLLAKYSAKRRLLFRVQDGLIRLPETGGFSFAKLMKALHMLVQKA
nr:phosphatase PAP2 family protein [uncultured Cohaesibacter sp.]